MGQVLQATQLSAAVVQAVERDVAGCVQRRRRQHEGLQRRRLAGFRAAVDDDVGRGRGGIEDERIAPHVEGPVDLTQRPAPLSRTDTCALEETVERDLLFQRWQPQRRRLRAVMGQLIADRRDQLAGRQDFDVGTVVDDDGVGLGIHPAGTEQLRLRDRMHDDRPVHPRRFVDAVDVGAAELDRQRARGGHQEADALVVPARLDVVGVLHADDLAGHTRAGHLQTDPVGGVLVDVFDPAHVEGLRGEQDVDAERPPLAGHVVEQVGVFGVVGEHQRELVGDDEQRGQRRKVVAFVDRVLVLGDRVERAALHPAAGLLQQLFAPRHLTTQGVGESVGQRTLLGHVGDHGDDLGEVPEDVRTRLALEVGVDDDQPVGRMGGQ